MDEVRLGDEILTASKSQKKWTKLYNWGHREPAASAEFLVFTMSDGQVLKISKNHLIFVADQAQIGGKVAKMAGQVCIGMYIDLNICG